MEDDEVLDLGELFRKTFSAFLKTWKIGLLLVLLGMGGMVFYVYARYVPRYRSQVTFGVSREVNGVKSFYYNRDAAKNLAVSIESLLNSDLMTTAICEELKTTYIPAALKFETIGNTNLFTIYGEGTDSGETKQVIDAFIHNYPRVFRMTLTDMELEIIEEPERSEKPYNQPRYLRQGAKGTIAAGGLYLMLLAAYVLLRRTITEEEEIKLLLHSRCLGTVPYIKSLEKGSSPLITRNNSRYFGLKESLRNIEICMEEGLRESGKNVFMLTSSLPDEGKTMVISNLSRIFAEKGKKTAVLDLDLRNPSLIRTFGKPEKNQVKKLHLDNLTLAVFSDSEYENLHIYGRRKKAEQVAEMLSSERLSQLLDLLKRTYDVVLIDTPPVYAMADAAVIAEKADRAILVIKEDFVSVSKVRESMEQLLESSPEVFGCIINGSRTSTSLYGRYGYGYGYGYSYGYGRKYGYGYGTKEKD